MKRTFFLISIFIVSLEASFAQAPVTDFGVFTPAEQALTKCNFDEEADAIVLLDKAQASYNDAYNLITQRRIRIKVLKENGIDRGNIRIRYYSGDNFELIRNIEAVVLSYDDAKKPVWSKLDRKLIYTTKLNNYYSEVSFALPNVKVGTIFEYKYESEMKHYGGLRKWVFQQDIPVVLSSYDLTIVPNAEFTYSVYKNSFLSVDVKPDSKNGSVLFEMHNIPGLKDETYMSAANDYLQRVEFQFSGYSQVESNGYSTSVTSKTSYTNTWDKLAKELLSDADFGTQLTKPLPGADLLQAQWAVAPNAFVKMKQIHDYVRSMFNWNHIYSLQAEDGLKGVWEKKTGTTGEINLILLNLLKEANLQVEPLLVSERQHGRVDTAYPFINQFNKVLAYVTLNDKHYILDGTDAETPSYMIPFELLNTTAFIVRKKNAALIKVTDDTKKNAAIVNVIGDITPGGIVHVDAIADYYDYAKAERKEKYTADKNVYQNNFLAPYKITKLDSFSITGITTDSLPLRHALKLDCLLDKTGDYAMLNYNLFTGFDKNPFLARQRFSDINFGCPYSCVFNGTFNLPPNLVPETLPKTLKLVMPDKSMSVARQIQQNGNTLQVMLRIDFLRTWYSADEYPELQEFYKQMLDLLKEPIVLKAKS